VGHGARAGKDIARPYCPVPDSQHASASFYEKLPEQALDLDTLLINTIYAGIMHWVIAVLAPFWWS
jgi:hypothetical protein